MDDMMMGEMEAKKAGSKALPGPTNPKVEKAVADIVPPPDEPLNEGYAEAMVDALNGAFAALLPGEELPPVEFTAAGPVEDLPEDVKARVVALATFLDQKKAPYKLDPAGLRTDEGLLQLSKTLHELQSDEKFLRGITRSAPTEPPEPADSEEPSPAPAPERSMTPKKPVKGME